MPLKRVISGGQVGADVAGLRAAKGCGIATGGYAPKGFRTINGPNPDLAMYDVVETSSSNYPPRTAKNVRESDATIRLAIDFSTRGEVLTQKLCSQYGKPCFSVRYNRILDAFEFTPRQVADWLKDVETLNVAGNAMTILEAPVEAFLTEVFELLKGERK